MNRPRERNKEYLNLLNVPQSFQSLRGSTSLAMTLNFPIIYPPLDGANIWYWAFRVISNSFVSMATNPQAVVVKKYHVNENKPLWTTKRQPLNVKYITTKIGMQQTMSLPCLCVS